MPPVRAAPAQQELPMNEIFDPLNLVLIAIALVVFWRLRSVLGQRTGLERPPFDPSVIAKKAPPEAANTNVLEFPQNKPGSDAVIDLEPKEPIWTGFAKPGSKLAAGLEKLQAADPAFEPKPFLAGARVAYEMVVEGFAKGDKPALKNLLSREVFDGFSKAIDARKAAGEKLDFQFIGFEKVEFLSVDVVEKRASIALKFESQTISATYDKAGSLIDGEPKAVRDVTDIWSFERDVAARDPNWLIVSTETQS
jgi:predicted lipid-binding transport protein (Tim44 family)